MKPQNFRNYFFVKMESVNSIIIVSVLISKTF